MSDVTANDVAGSSFRNILGRSRGDAFIAFGVILVVMMLIIPLPTVLLDLLIAINLMLSLLVILLVLYNRDPLEFTLFPTVLLVSSVFGLALNVSSTRLILGEGSNFNGRIIRTFATFVVGTDGQQGLVIGFIIFIILVAVQFMVITKGATRVAEVAARFALDGLPQKQMAIDSEYSSGAITETEMRTRKKHLDDTVQFYGSMDGATKFIAGTVKVSIVITLVNIIGGLIVGTAIHREPFTQAITTYVSLTIGDGLVSQVPVLLVSVATGLIVTRSISEGSFSNDVQKQFSQQSRIYYVAAIFLFIMGLLPGFPWYLMLPLSVFTGYLAFRLNNKKKTEQIKVASKEKSSADIKELSPIVPLDPISLELGFGLIPLVDKDQGAELLERITRIRKEAALDMGLVVPRVRIMDNMRLEPSEYAFKIRGTEVGRSKIQMNSFMVLNPRGGEWEIEGEPTIEPAYGMRAIWIGENMREKAERAGYTVIDGPSIIATHLTGILKKHANELLGRQEVKSMLDTLAEDYPAVVNEVNKVFSLGEIQKILQGLLMEEVSIRNLVVILETVADYVAVSRDSGFLIEKTRQALRRQICLQYADADKIMHIYTIAPSLEKKIVDSGVEISEGGFAAIDEKLQRRLVNSIVNTVQSTRDKGIWPVLLCSASARVYLRSAIQQTLRNLPVLSVPELSNSVQLDNLGEIQLGDAE